MLVLGFRYKFSALIIVMRGRKMIGNFSDDFGDLYIFFDEGEIEGLENGAVTGYLADIDNPELAGRVEVVYDETMHGSRPLVGREPNSSLGEVQVVIEDKVYGKLVDGEAYSGSVGRYNSVPSRAEVALVPEDAEEHQDLLEEIEALEKPDQE